MKNRSKMILGLASLLGVTAGATAVSGFAWFVTTKTAAVDVTNIGVYNNNPSLSVNITNMKGVKLTNNAANDFNLEAGKDSTSLFETFTGNGSTEFTLTNTPVAEPSAYVDGVLTAITWSSAEPKKVTFASAPEAGKEIRIVYVDNAALTDVSSADAINFYDPTWMAAYEGTKATKIPYAVAGEQYISFDMVFNAPTTGSLKIYLDRPTITPLDGENNADKEAAAVARVGFASNTANILTLSNKDHDDTGYEKGISKTKVEAYPGAGTSAGANANTTAGDYTILDVVSDCDNLVKPSTDNYSILSAAPTADAAHMYLGEVTTSNVTIHVSIWLEGTSHVDAKGNNSTPIGGEINVSLPIVAFGA